jgi:hypothetical protein
MNANSARTVILTLIAHHGKKLSTLDLCATPQLVTKLPIHAFSQLLALVISVIPVLLQINVKQHYVLETSLEKHTVIVSLSIVMTMMIAPLIHVIKRPEFVYIPQLTLLNVTDANLIPIANPGLNLKNLMNARKHTVTTMENVTLVHPVPRQNAEPFNVQIALLSLLVIKSAVLIKMELLHAFTPKSYAMMETTALKTIAMCVTDNAFTAQFPLKFVKVARLMLNAAHGLNKITLLQNAKKLIVRTTSVIPDQPKIHVPIVLFV